MNVAIVEDELLISMVTLKMVESLGHHVTDRYASAEEALDAFDSARPDLVLMDIHLQGKMDGIEAAAEIERRWQIPCAFTSAYSDGETRLRADKARPVAFLPKPITLSVFKDLFDGLTHLGSSKGGGSCLLA